MAQFAGATSERERARARARYQSPALKAALERALKRERGGRSCERTSLSAPMDAIYERPFRSLIARVVPIAARNQLRARIRGDFPQKCKHDDETRGTNDRCASERNKLISWSRTDQVNSVATNFLVRSLITALYLNTLL